MASAAKLNTILNYPFEATTLEKRRMRRQKVRDENSASRRSNQDPGDEQAPQRINWPVTAWLVLLHIGALAAFWTFTWPALVITMVLHWMAGGVGICLGYHRLFTHASFQTYHPVKLFLAVMGSLAGEGAAVDWVANHRQHHAHSDHPGDPHSPQDGAWWSHMFWLAYTRQGADRDRHVARWAPDLVKDAGMVKVGNWFLGIHFITAAILFAAGYLMGGWPMAFSFIVYGMFVRLVFVLHTTWFVNSASHMWGYRNYETTDDSRNNWWVALLAYGEGWHNNHHAYPRMAPHGHKWWELDVTYTTIRLMKMVGLAWDIVDYKRKKLVNDYESESEPESEASPLATNR